MPDFIQPYSTTPVQSPGLLGISAGLSSLKDALMTYQQRKESQKANQQKDAMLSMQAQQQGLIYNPNDGTMTKDPSQQTKKDMGEAAKVYGLLTEDQKNSTYGHGLLMKLSGQGQENQTDTSGLLGDREPQGGAQIPMQAAQNPPDPFAPLPGYKSKQQKTQDNEFDLFKRKEDYKTQEDASGGGDSLERELKLSKLAENLKKDLDPDASRTGNFGKISNTLIQSQKLKKLAQDSGGNIANLDSRQQEELAIGLATMLSQGSVAGESRVKSLVPSTAIGNTQKLKEWLFNEPMGTNQQAFVQRVMGTIDRESDLANEQLNTIRTKRLGAHQALKKYAPDTYGRILEDYGVKEGGKGIINKDSGGGRVRVSNGKETLEIDASDLGHAQKDGYNQVK